MKTLDRFFTYGASLTFVLYIIFSVIQDHYPTIYDTNINLIKLLGVFMAFLFWFFGLIYGAVRLCDIFMGDN